MQGMEEDFARDLIRRFGEDRFYHALLRWGCPREAKLIHLALGGTEAEWIRKCDSLRLKAIGEDIMSFPVRPDLIEGESWVILCRTACTISKHHKQFALKSSTLPSSIHAGMFLGPQNEWTRKYAEEIEKN
jgi:hypothetical protein